MNKDLDAYLSSGCILLFCGAHSASFKSDILHATLYANLLATMGGNDQEGRWRTYTQTLNKFGFPLNNREARRVEFDNNRLLDIVVQSAVSALKENEQHALSSVFSELGALPANSSAIEAIITRLEANADNRADDTDDAGTKNNRPQRQRC